MKAAPPSDDTLIDFITGLKKPNNGAEANRQHIERLLVDDLGYDREAVEVDAPIILEMDDQRHMSTVDLVVNVHNRRYMAIKCAAGSLASREREIISAARLMDRYQIPLSVASNGETAIVWDTLTGECLGSGLEAIPTADRAHAQFDPGKMVPLAQERRYRQMLIFRSYDAMNIHR